MLGYWIIFGIVYFLAAMLMHNHLKLIDRYDSSEIVYPESWYYGASLLWGVILFALLINRIWMGFKLSAARHYIRRKTGR